MTGNEPIVRKLDLRLRRDKVDRVETIGGIMPLK
jgi:hypothetical protein